MKNILIIFFIASVLNAQALELIYDGVTPKWAIDVATDEYGYDNSVTGLDLNGSEMITATADKDFSGAGHWTGLTVTGGVGTFTSTATLPSSAHENWIVGHNYTIQHEPKSNGVLGSDLVSGWSFSGGWSNSPGYSSVVDANSFNVTGNGYGLINNSYSLNGKTLFLEISGTTASAGGMKVVNANGGSTPLVCETTTSGAFTISGTFTATSNYIYLRNTNAGQTDITSFTIKEVTYSSFKVKTDNDSTTHTTTGTSATKAFTFTYSGGSQDIQLIGVGTDTWTVDNFSITEAYNLEVYGWFNSSNISDNGGIVGVNAASKSGFSVYLYNSRLRAEVLTANETFFKDITTTISASSNVWYNFQYKINRSDATVTLIGYGQTITGSITGMPKILMEVLYFGYGWVGQPTIKIGETKIIRKDGTGAVVSTSIYDWKGTSATFLNDKGTNGNHLTGVNVTTADQVKYSTGKYK